MVYQETQMDARTVPNSRRARAVANLPAARLVERTDITGDLMVIKLEPEMDEFRFKAGQYCTLGLQGIERAYSIVSAPYEPYLEIFVELVPDGELTPLMWKLKVGDAMTIRPRAKGLFTMDPRYHHHFTVSTVTGAGPSVSILRQHLRDNGDGHTFYVLLGASYHDELTYDAELGSMAKAHPGFIKFVPTVSRPSEERNSAWEGDIGRVNAIFQDYLEKFDPPMHDTLIYTCGHPGMIEDVKNKVVPQGWKFKEERFWKE